MPVRAGLILGVLLLLSVYGLVPMTGRAAPAPSPPSPICKTDRESTNFNDRHDLLLVMKSGVCATIGKSGTFTSVMHSVNLTITGPIDDWENILFQYNFTGYKGGVLNYAQGATYIGGSLPQTDQAFIETFPNVSVDMARTYATWTVYDRAFTHKNYTLISFPSISTIDVAVT